MIKDRLPVIVPENVGDVPRLLIVSVEGYIAELLVAVPNPLKEAIAWLPPLRSNVPLALMVSGVVVGSKFKVGPA